MPFHIFQHWIADVKKTSIPLDQVFKKSCDTFQQKWKQAGRAPQIHNQYLKSNSSLPQCRINNSSKCSNCYGPRAFGGPAVFCNKTCLLHYI